MYTTLRRAVIAAAAITSIGLASVALAQTFEPKVDFPVGSGAVVITAADIDGDGRPDLVVTNLRPGVLGVLRNTSTQGALSFEPKVSFPAGSDTQGVAVADLDGDGKPDVVTAASDDNTVRVFLNASSPGAISLAQVAVMGVNTAHKVAIADLDGDGRPDLAVTSNSSATVYLFQNTTTAPGSISFAFAGGLPASTPLNNLALADIDGDGIPDLLYVLQHNAINLLGVRRNLSGFSFGPELQFPTGNGPNGLRVADVDGDGKIDVVVSDGDDSAVAILRNVSMPGSIAFDSFLSFPTLPTPGALALGDLDGDGRPDVVVGENGANSAMATFRNESSLGSISLSPRNDNPADCLSDATIADLDGDGMPDVASVCELETTLAIFRQFRPGPTPTAATPTPSAAPTPGCGNGIVEPPETCDPPDSVVGPCGQLCRSDCTFCGDGVVQTADAETCDDGNCLQCDPSHPQKPLDSCNNMCQGLICNDPAKIKLTTGLDVLQFHGRMVPLDGGTMDFGGSDVAISLTTAQNLVFTTSVPAGAIETLTSGSFKYRNAAAKRDGGIYKLKAHLTRGTYKATAIAYGDLSGATADMVTHVTIGGQGWSVHGLWRQTGSGWVFNGGNLLP